MRTPSAHDGKGPGSAVDDGKGVAVVLVAGSGSLPISQTKPADVTVAAGAGRSLADESQTATTPLLNWCNLPV